MKTFIIVAVLFFNFSAWAEDSSLDDAISERLAPLVSNYVGDFGVSIQVEHVFSLAPGQTKKIPVLFLPVQILKAENLQDCEDNASSMVCKLAGAIKTYIAKYNVTMGKINLDLKIFQNTKLIKEISDVEVLSF